MVRNWIGIAAVTINLCKKKGWGNTKTETIIEFGYSKGKTQLQVLESVVGQTVNGVRAEWDGLLSEELWKPKRIDFGQNGCSEISQLIAFSRSVLWGIQVQRTLD